MDFGQNKAKPVDLSLSSQSPAAIRMVLSKLNFAEALVAIAADSYRMLAYGSEVCVCVCVV